MPGSAECTHSFDLRVFRWCLCRFAIFFFVEIREVKEQRVRIKFYFKLGRSVAETQKIIKQAFGDDALAQPQIYN